jgi:hypothetical protein
LGALSAAYDEFCELGTRNVNSCESDPATGYASRLLHEPRKVTPMVQQKEQSDAKTMLEEHK